MRFSPQGNLLAIVGSGPIELWDPVALNLVAVLGMSDQATDVAFAPDGKTLAAVSRAGDVDSLDDPRFGGANPAERFRQLAGDARVQRRRRSGRRRLERRDLVLAQRPLPGNRAAVARLAEDRPPSRRSAAIEPKRSEASGADGQRPKDRPREREGPRPRRRGPPPSLAFDDSGRMVLHDLQGLRVYHRGLDPAESPPAFRIAAPADARRFRLGSDARHGQNARRQDHGARSLDEHLSLARRIPRPARFRSSLPARSAAEPHPERWLGGKARDSSEPSGPIFLVDPDRPGGEKIYTIEQIPGSSSVLRVWELDAELRRHGRSSPRARVGLRFPTARSTSRSGATASCWPSPTAPVR